MYSAKHGGTRFPILLAVLAGLAAVSATGVSDARAQGDGLPAESLKVSLLRWIGEHSEYDVSRFIADPPEVAFCKHGSTLIYEGKAIHFDDRLNGVYDQETKQICLAKPWSASRVRDRGILLHELVHHVQFESRTWICPKATEREAYRLQESWLLEKGYKPDFNWLYVIMTSSCTPRDVHP